MEVEDRAILSRLMRNDFQWTDHGVCRMDCRKISEQEVFETLQTGRINRRKSEMSLRPCPKYVVDAQVKGTKGTKGTKHKKKNVQCVFGGCSDHTKVITVIDKDFDHPCGPC